MPHCDEGLEAIQLQADKESTVASKWRNPNLPRDKLPGVPTDL